MTDTDNTPDLDISYHTGDVLASDEYVIAHGCNTTGDPNLYAAGMAGAVARRYPIARGAWVDAVTAGAFHGGDISTVWITSDPAFPRGRCIINAATQIRPGADGDPALVTRCFVAIARWAENNDCTRIAMPRIGCGIAGLDWNLDVLPALSNAARQAYMLGLPMPHLAVYDLPINPNAGSGSLFAPIRSNVRGGRW